MIGIPTLKKFRTDFSKKEREQKSYWVSGILKKDEDRFYGKKKRKNK